MWPMGFLLFPSPWGAGRLGSRSSPLRPSAPLSLRLRLSSPPRCVGGVCSLFLLGSRWNCRRRLSLLLNQPNSWAVAQATRGVREKRTDSEKFYGSGAVAYTAVITQR